ncbi:MAG: ABC transporter ATP-binding protein [Chlamydiales bacterium]
MDLPLGGRFKEMPSVELPRTLSAFIWLFLKNQRKWLLFAVIFSLGWSLDHTLWPYVIMTLIDVITHFTGPKTDAWVALATPIAMGISLWITVEIAFRLSGFSLMRFIPIFEGNVRMSMFEYVLNHSQHYFSNHLAGEIANKISDMPQSLTRLLMLIIQLFIPVGVALIISTLFFANISPFFAIILLSWVGIHLGICFSFSKSCSSIADIHARARSKLAGRIVDCLTNHANVRLFARNRYEKQYLAHFQEDEIEKHEQSLWVIEKMKAALGLASFLGVGIIINGYMLYSWQQGRLSTGEVVFIFNTTWNISMMTWLAGLELPQLYKEIGICQQALTIIRDNHEITDDPNAKPLVVHHGEIIFQDVSFRYKDQSELFENKNIVLRAREKVGLVGFSGSGKTTFINLILRNFNIEKGVILIDGQDISKVTQESLREHISLIPQEPVLFHRTLMENIRYGRLDATDEEVIDASKKAHCHEFILQFPQHYKTYVGERGAKLSGGQRQRIAIARAILKNAPILILDEATSALDSVTEKEIQEGLDIAMRKQTVIAIAHRLSTLSGMDRILVFHQGKIVEDGTHAELIKTNGHYTRLWHMQVGGFIPDHPNGKEGRDE